MEGIPISAITLTGSGGLFTRMGYIGGRINSLLNIQGNASLTAPAVSAGVAYTNLLSQFISGTAQSDIFDGYVPNVLNPSRAKLSEITNLKALFQADLVRQVNDSVTLRSYSLSFAIVELLRQMGPNVSASYVNPNTVAATTPAAASGNTGKSTVTSSVVGPLMPHPLEFTTGSHQMDRQNIFPETIVVKCTTDSFSGGATKNSEPYSVIGATATVTDPLLWNFTTLFGAPVVNGSGASASTSTCDASIYSGSGPNLLDNGDFFNYTSHLPNQWVAVAGVAGTDFSDVGASVKSIVGTQCLALLANASQLVTLTQQFGSAGGTTSTLSPNSVYAVNVYGLIDAGSTGTIVIDLIDQNSNVINDNNGVANSFTFTSASLGTTYAYPNPNWAYFRTPAVLPTSVRIRLRTTVHIATANTYISHLSMQQVLPIYVGGPYIAIFSGSAPAVAGDSYNCAFTNNFGGITNKTNLQTLWNWLTDARANGYGQLPVAGSTLIADSLIS